MTGRASTWAWRAERSSGEVVRTELTDRGFASQSDAESWLGEYWAELADADVDQVSLLCDGQVVYGPMGLAPG